MKILNRLPVGVRTEVLFLEGEAITIKRYQIAIWASLNDATRPFPAVLDTGLTHNFSITESLLKKWAGLSRSDLKLLGTAKLKGEKIDQCGADLRLHCNQPGTIQLSQGNQLLRLDEGLSIVPEGSIRLPLLGLRAIINNDLRLVVEGKRRVVTLRTKGWL